MSQIRLAAILSMSLAFSVAVAQETLPDCPAKTAAPRKQTPIPLFIVPPGDVYGTYVPYTGPLLNGAPQAEDTDVPPAACVTPKVQTAINRSPLQPPPPVKAQPQKDASAPAAQKASPAQGTGADALPAACVPPVYVVPPNDVYGPYVPYLPPPNVCVTPNAQAASTLSSHANSSAVQKQPDSLMDSASPALFKLTQPAGTELALAPAAPPAAPAGEGEGEGGFVRPVPLKRAPLVFPDLRPFHTYALGFKASTLGAGVELATPLAGRINLRSSLNFFAFNDPFDIDGVDYGARLHLQSSETTVDWFITPGLHISPGILYFKDSMSAPVSVRPGQTFVLGGQPFLNSVDDPVTGTSSVVYPHKFAPLLLFGIGNLIPRSGGHLSLPVEFGAAYTGAPVINVVLNGTACTTEGCVSFAQNAEAQSFLKKEIQKLNNDLKSFPFFPIVSVGVAYRF